MTRQFASILLLLFVLPPAERDKVAELDGLLARYHELGQFNGAVLVAERGQVIYKKGFGLANVEWKIPNGPDTKFRLGSITKQFTAAVVLQLVEEGKLRLDGRLGEYVPEAPKKVGDRVTIHQLLNHTSGIPSQTNKPGFFEKLSRHPHTPLELAKLTWEMDFEFEPGTRFSYNNTGYNLLGLVIEKVTGKSYEENVQQRIFGPLGMTSSGYDSSERIIPNRAAAYERALDGYRNAPYLDMTVPFAAGSLYSTVEDLYRWDQALYTDRPLPARSRELMFRAGLQNYGYGVVVSEVSAGTQKVRAIAHGGGINGFNTVIQRLVDDRHLIVLLNNTGGTKLTEMADKIRSILYGAPHTPPLRPVSQVLSRTILEKGATAAVAQFRELRAGESEKYDSSAPELDWLGRELLRRRRAADAIEILKVGTDQYPAVASLHHTLGDAYREAGSRDLAIRSYAKALELAPMNRALADKIRGVQENIQR